MSDKPLPEGILFGLGNPLLDIQAHVDKAFLEKWGLKENDAILCDDSKVPLFAEMEEKFKSSVEYIAGGATQNVMRVVQWLIGQPHVTTFLGCVGDDAYGETLERAARRVGVNVVYQVEKGVKTGTCAVCVFSIHRSLCAHLAAANMFKIAHLHEQSALMKKAQFFYCASFPLTVCPAGVLELAKHASDTNKVFSLNLSAPFLCSVFRDQMMSVMPYVDILFGNQQEALEFADVHGFCTKKTDEIALKIAALEKANKRSRMVVFTQGAEPVFVVRDGTVKEYPVAPLELDQIVDSNGAGDAFVGGFLAQYIRGRSIDECVRCGIWTAQVVLKRSGCTMPEKCEFC